MTGTTETPRRAAAIARLSPLALLAALTVACGTSAPRTELTEEQKIQQKIEAAYASHFETTRPSHVVITYPEDVTQLPRDKKVEYRIVRRVLREQNISNESKRYRDAVVELPRPGSKERTFHAYDVPEELATRIRGGSLLVLNLAATGTVRTRLHPLSVKYDIRVASLHDPISVQ